MLAGRKVGAVS